MRSTVTSLSLANGIPLPDGSDACVARLLGGRGKGGLIDLVSWQFCSTLKSVVVFPGLFVLHAELSKFSAANRSQLVEEHF